MIPDSYRLTCVRCGKSFPDREENFLLQCDGDHAPSLLRSEYKDNTLPIDAADPGMFRYGAWLPIRRSLDTAVLPAVFRSEALAQRIGLENLWIAFNGYWPERGALMESCSFKELEAHPVCARVPLGAEEGSLVVASAGNTGRAFLQTCSRFAVPALVVVPEAALPAMWMTVGKHPEVRLAVLKGDGDYLDAIELAGRIAALDGFFPEGGAKNVARRDGMGVVVLAAAETIGRVPDHYFQAVGSGTGGIAAWEAGVRLRRDGRFGRRKMKLHLVQNAPFALMSAAWSAGSRQLEAVDEREAKRRIAALHSGVLSNRRPPYGIAGGVYDVLRASGGEMYTVASEEAQLAGWLFESLEGCDLDPAAEVALAGLVRAVRQAKIRPSDVVLLNLTGGGKNRLVREQSINQVQADYEFEAKDLEPLELERRLRRSGERISV